MAGHLVAGNWKMHGTRGWSLKLLAQICLHLDGLARRVELLVLPPYTALAAAHQWLEENGAPVALGAQNLHWAPEGAFTGEISGPMLRDAGCTYVLVGHSERRAGFGEAGVLLERKLRAALEHGLTPILCIGENLAVREAGGTNALLDSHLQESLFQLSPDEGARVVLAYEPVWAIGTGRNATPAQAEEAHQHIRAQLSSRWGAVIAGGMRILYGGSVNAGNAAELLAQHGVNGVLVGGASLRAEDYVAIARAAADSRAAGSSGT